MINRKAAPLRPPMKRPHIATTPVESSAIRAVGHDPKRKVLRVEFISGGVYDYPDTSIEDHQALMTAKSPGAHLMKHIRHRGFTKVAA